MKHGDPEYLKAVADYHRELRILRQWEKRWPNHCEKCGGWGVIDCGQRHPYGMGSAYESMTELCEALDADICHRCGKSGRDEDGEQPCPHCGHFYDDGSPGGPDWHPDMFLDIDEEHD